MQRPKISKDSVTQTIDLEEIFGVDLSEFDDVRQVIAEAILERIRERTQGGIGMRPTGQRYDLGSVPYSEKYAKQKGVSLGDVDLTLFGEMLLQMDIVEEDGNLITLGWNDDLNNKKAYAHTVGKKDPEVKVPARPFFGINNDDVKAIRREFGDEIRRLVREAQEGE